MSFEHASVTKGLMLALALTSITAGIFDVKHYLHLQLVPHISKYHQYWRLFTIHVACANSSDLLMTELLLYNVGVHIERSFGSVKFASFAIVTTMLNTMFLFIALLLCHTLPYVGRHFDHIPAGPSGLVFNILYQYERLLPEAYRFKIFGLGFNDKIWAYLMALQLATARTPATLLPTFVGLLSGAIYRSDLMQLKGWRVPHRAVRLSQKYLRPLLLPSQPVRRTTRALPESRERARSDRQQSNGRVPQDEAEVITTARLPRARSAPPRRVPADGVEVENTPSEGNVNTSGAGVMRQWMSELTGGARPAAGGVGTVRAPSESEIQMLTDMFPNVGRDVVLGVLQRSANLEAAAETLLSTQT